MQIQIPPEAENLIRQCAGDAGFDDVQQYVLQRALCSDEDLAAMDAAANDPRAVVLILEGLQSGPMTSMTAEDWSKLRDLVCERPLGNPSSPVHRALPRERS